MTSTVVQISDLSRSINVLEATVKELDEDINQYALEILRLQKLMSSRITQRDALIGTSSQISEYRKLTFPEIK